MENKRLSSEIGSLGDARNATAHKVTKWVSPSDLRFNEFVEAAHLNSYDRPGQKS
jgi:hypothetical protein